MRPQDARPGHTFIDVGANIGYYSLLAARIVGQKGRVYAIEGSPTICAMLQRNIALNHATSVEIVHAIAASHDGEQEFWLAPEAELGHSTSVETLARASGMNDHWSCGELWQLRVHRRTYCFCAKALLPEAALKQRGDFNRVALLRSSFYSGIIPCDIRIRGRLARAPLNDIGRPRATAYRCSDSAFPAGARVAAPSP